MLPVHKLGEETKKKKRRQEIRNVLSLIDSLALT